eukprot:SAG11_NODE_6502_length_1301_cov_1.219634_2_plen_191_part_00
MTFAEGFEIKGDTNEVVEGKLTVAMKPTMTLKEIKQYVEKKVPGLIKFDAQMLFREAPRSKKIVSLGRDGAVQPPGTIGKELKDSKTVKYYRIQDGDQLMLIRRSRADLKEILKARKEKAEAEKKKQSGWTSEFASVYENFNTNFKSSSGLVPKDTVGWEPDSVGWERDSTVSCNEHFAVLSKRFDECCD